MLNKPQILVDKEALRFIYNGKQVNLFWSDLFGDKFDFHNELFDEIKNIYDECIRQDIKVKLGGENMLGFEKYKKVKIEEEGKFPIEYALIEVVGPNLYYGVKTQDKKGPRKVYLIHLEDE